MLGFGKWFVIFIFLSLAVGYGTKNWIIAGQMMIAFIVIKVIWRFFTR
jgi:hypothetical protein